MPLFGKIIILSLSLVNFRVSRFHVSHLTPEIFKLCLQNTLNMSKAVRVYFGVLQSKYERINLWNESHGISGLPGTKGTLREKEGLEKPMRVHDICIEVHTPYPIFK